MRLKLMKAMVLSCVLLAPSALADPGNPGFRIYFPKIELLTDEQIESFSILVPCGHIESVTGIPDDWNVEVTRAISATEQLRASAGHGSSYKRNMKAFDGMIRVVPKDRCFSVTAEITAMFDDGRVISLSRGDLKLRK